jgi:hypothetical protein
MIPTHQSGSGVALATAKPFIVGGLGLAIGLMAIDGQSIRFVKAEPTDKLIVVTENDLK